jgi:transcriptional regulator with XRE-family HTH domain
MPPRSRLHDRALRDWSRNAIEIGEQLRAARHMAGLTLRQLGPAIGVSRSELSRRELGKAPYLTGPKLALHAAAVGLKLSIRLWPVGGAVRDAAQARYVARFLSRVGRLWRTALEVPIPVAGDLRAVDVMLRRGATVIAVEVITRLVDLQAQIRAAQLKARDVGASRLILVIAGTNANRRVLAAVRPTLVAAFDLDTRRLLADLAAGRDPGRDGIVVI